MRLLVGSAGGSILQLLVLLLHCAILSQLNSGTTVAASRLHATEVELQWSLARYRQLLQNDDPSSDLVKPQEPETRPGQEEKKETKTNADAAAGNPQKDEYQAVQTVEVEDHNQYGEIEVKKNEKRNSEKTEENGDQATTADDPNKAKDEQKQEKDKAKEQKLSQSEEPRHNVEKTKQPNLYSEKPDEGKDQQKPDEVKTEKENQQEEPREVKVEKAEEKEHPSKKTEEQQDQVEEQNEAEVQKTEQETDMKTEEQQTEKRKESESKTEKTTDESDEQSESNTQEEKTSKEEPFIFPEPYLLGPTITDWDEQRGSWLDSNPDFKTKPGGKPRVLIVTGSQPNPCRTPEGDKFHVKSFKLKIDYARMHNYEIYYSFAWLDPLFGSYWVKLPIVRKLMITHPEVEWFFWIDSDAVFTDMLFEAPFHTYEGINMVMWGYPQGFYVEKSWVAFNAGVFLIRNCQWSLDLFDKWSPMGPDGPVRDEYGKILTSFLSHRPENYPADDQSALAYQILTDDAVNSKVKLVELNDYMISAWWVEVVDNYETSMEKYHPGLGDYRWPWITHFTGCGPCGADGSGSEYPKCMNSIERAFNFADNQMLAYMGLQHESLSSDSLVRIRNETDRPLELVGANPWAERIVQLATAVS